MLLPGPEAQQLATYIGWLLHKTKGGLIAGLLFILPGFVSILILSILYVLYRDVAFVEGLFYGIKPAVLAIVAGAVIKIGKKALKNEVMIIIAVCSFIAIFFLQIPFPVIVLSAAIIGFIGGKIWERKFYIIKGHADKEDGTDAVIDSMIEPLKPSLKMAMKTLVIFGGLWFIPIIALVLLLDKDSIFIKEALFFSETAVVTFGGAYAVLAFIAQKAVESFAWLRPGEMLDGLGMAETTPGPLIQVVQFVAFMGAYRNPGSLDPLTAGILASVLATWVTFVPCFLFIFLGAPYIEYLRGNKSLTTALSGITAAVVGVILNLGVWFSINTIFGEVAEKSVYGVRLLVPDWATLDYWSAGIAIVAGVTYFGFRLNMLKTILLGIILGILVVFLAH